VNPESIEPLQPQRLFLLVDDSPDDLVLLKRAFATVAAESTLVALESGQEAIDYLKAATQPGERRPLPIPSAILTDLKMPGIDGFDLLRWIRSLPALRNVFVSVMTGSNIEKDIIRAYELGANCFLTKQANPAEQIRQVRHLVAFIKARMSSEDLPFTSP
jgi:CheY-like chemotaxis protein